MKSTGKRKIIDILLKLLRFSCKKTPRHYW